MSDLDKPVPASLAARRERTIAILGERFSRDVIDLDEFESRVDRAHRASSGEELEVLIKDLGPVEELPSEALVPAPAVAVDVVRPERKRLMAIFGGVARKGQWVVPRQLSVAAVFGGVSLDLRDATFGAGVTEVSVRAVFGGVEIIVPPHVAVEADGIAIFGGFDEMQRSPVTPDPDRPLVRVTGLAAFGGVAISTRVPKQGSRVLEPGHGDGALDGDSGKGSRRLGDGSDR